MSANADEFLAWACDPARSPEERYGVVRLIETTSYYWRRKQGIVDTIDIQAKIQSQKQRGLDPTYKPKYTRAAVESVADVIPEVLHLSFHGHEDRPLRDISFLRFFPHLQTLNLSQTEIRDLSPLVSLQSLVNLTVMDEIATQIGIIGKLCALERLSLYLSTPWPELAGLENLTGLKHLVYSGNLVVLGDIPELPALRDASISYGRYRLPMRRVADLPAMPELRRLKLDYTASLDGIGRHPKLLNLEIRGCQTDLRPLEDLQELTHLIIRGGDYPDTVSISRMKNLCRVTLDHELPPDLTPLADLPRLHEIQLENAAVEPAELGSLNALCVPWDEEFIADPPRPLAPLRLLIRKKGEEEALKHHSSAAPRPDEDLDMSKSESIWFIRRLNGRLARLLGKGWGKISERFATGAGYLQVPISRHRDIDRLPAIVRVLRELIAEARYPWDYLLIVDSLAQYERTMDEIADDEDTDEFDVEREREEWEDMRRSNNERREYLKRKYQLRLSDELGVPLPAPAAPAPDTDEEDESWQPTADEDQPEFELGTELHLYAVLTETSFIINDRDRDRELAEMLMEIKAED